jgi:rhodanese-related sulfurtransferase/membrane protein insertase Oxa1/YidC/SpoIIIJ/phosphohistidine swiveling domain-containing protein
MRTVGCVRRSVGGAGFVCLAAVAISAFWALGSTPAQAIPSPELVIGSFVSLSQLLALASAVLGGGAAYATMRARRGGGGGLSRGLVAGAVVMFALFCVSAALNIYQFIEQKNERQARLEQTLLRPSRAPAGLPDDPDAKELNFAEQSKHPLRIGTAEAARLLAAHNRGEADDTVFLDVREHAEQVMGSLKGATVVRFPDLNKANLDLTNKKVILFCHNGNRSSETAEAMAKMGIDAKFVVGGLEKWIVEGRDMTGMNVRNLEELRAIPNYPNRNTLLDTEQVKGLIARERAVLVDIRYPTDFAASHIAGAINLSLRRMPTEVMNEQIAKLPNRPIVLPCYDRRGCFFAEVLGYELTKAGHDVRGRYTLPWEFFVTRGRPPHVEAWIAENNQNLWAKAASALAAVLSRVAQWIGVIATIGLLAILSRLLILPFSLKAERDQLRARAAEQEMTDIKQRLKSDPLRKARAISAFYKRHGITPGRNLIALLFLPIMAVALLAVQELVGDSRTPIGWLPSLAERDPWLILPLVFGVLITIYLDMAFATTRARRIAIWLLALPALKATGAIFSAGADVYLIVSAALLVAQRMWVCGIFAHLHLRLSRSRLPAGVFALADVTQLWNKGNKAYRLARMRAIGMPVPDGVVLTPEFLQELEQAPAERRERELDWLWNRLGRVRLAVRSSGSHEDGADASFAGVFESVIDVDRSGLAAAIARVRHSFEAARVSAYMHVAGTGNVLVQRMVEASYSGVLFTRDPSMGGLAMVEMVQGTAENLVSGLVRPQTYRFGRITKSPFGPERAPIDLAVLLQLGDTAELLFGQPQDIEWTYRDGQFYLVQSRDITRPVAGDAQAAAMQGDLARVIESASGADPDETLFGKNEISEMLPRPSALSLSLMEALWTAGGSVDLAARELGLSYRVEDGTNYLTTIMGRLYVDKREERKRALVIGPLASRRLLRDADKIERDFRDNFLPQFLSETRLLNVADFEKLPTAELIAEIKRLHDRFVYDTHVAVDVINITAGFYLERARQTLRAHHVDASSLLGHIPETHEGHAIAEISAAAAKSRRWLLLKSFGHRAVFDYELAEPRYAEDINTLTRMIVGRAQSGRTNYQPTPPLSKAQARMVDIARRFQTLKEDAKHHSLGELAVLRRALLTLDRRFGLEGRVFDLRFDELFTISGSTIARLRELARERHEEAQLVRGLASLPSTLTARDLEAASAGDLDQRQATPGAIRGTRVAGSAVTEGRARVVTEEDAERGSSMDGFRDGDIIVASMINPAWLPYFSRAGGFVSEVGGWLSHPAILAREYDVPMIVGTSGMSGIVDGGLIRLHLDGRIEIVVRDAMAGRVAAA